jgi:hypothetical protein
MQMNDKDEWFLVCRDKVVKIAMPLLLFLLALVIFGSILIWVFVPILINPFYVSDLLRQGKMEPHMFNALAGLSTVWFMMVLLLTAVLLGTAIFILMIEKRYLRIIRELRPKL